MGHIVFGSNHDAGRIFIQAVDDARADDTVDTGEIPAVIQQGIH